MNKRGDWGTLQVITTLAGVIVALLLVAIVYRSTSQHGAENQFLAVDSALLSDAIMSVPGDIELIYPGQFYGRYANLDNSSFSIFDELPKPNQTPMYLAYFIPRGDVRVLEKSLESDVIYFVKENNTYTISTYPKIEVGISND